MSLQVIFDIVWLLFLLLVFSYFWRIRLIYMQARLWIQTTGRICSFEWVTKGYSLWPKIEYSYQAEGQDWRGEHIFLMEQFHSSYARRVAYRIALAYKEDKEIIVYYNPDKPQKAVLDIRIPNKLNFILGFVAFFFMVHLVLFVV